MSQQVKHSLGQVAVMMVLAVLGVAVEQQTNVLQNLGVDPLFFPIVGAILASAVRYVEGLKDAGRAAEGVVVPADVGYSYLKGQAEDRYNYSVAEIPGTDKLQI